MDQQYALAVLTEELKNADKRLQDTSDYLDLAIQFNRNPYPTVNTQARVRLAARAYRLAVEERATALSRLSRFTMDSAVPEDLKLRGPQKASSKPMLLRQSA